MSDNGFIHADCDECGAPGIMRPGDTPYCGPCWSARVAQQATDTAEEPPFSEQERAAGNYDGGEHDPVHARHLRLSQRRLSWAGLDPVRARQVGSHGLAGH